MSCLSINGNTLIDPNSCQALIEKGQIPCQYPSQIRIPKIPYFHSDIGSGVRLSSRWVITVTTSNLWDGKSSLIPRCLASLILSQDNERNWIPMEGMVAELWLCHQCLSHEGSLPTQPTGTSGRLKLVEIGFSKTSKCLWKTAGQEAGLAKGPALNEERKAG